MEAFFIFAAFAIFYFIIFQNPQAKSQPKSVPNWLPWSLLGGSLGIAILTFSLMQQPPPLPVKPLPRPIVAPEFLGPVTFDANGKAIAPKLPAPKPAAPKFELMPPPVVSVTTSGRLLLFMLPLPLFGVIIGLMIRRSQMRPAVPFQPVNWTEKPFVKWFEGMPFWKAAAISAGWFVCFVIVPVVIWAIIRESVPFHERVAWTERNKMFVMPFVFMGFPVGIVLMQWSIANVPWIRRICTPQTAEDKKWLPPEHVMGDDGWMPSQKRRMASWFPVVATFIATLLGVLTVREYGRSDSNFNWILAYFVFWSIIAFAITSRLNRWAYPERYPANNLRAPVEQEPVQGFGLGDRVTGRLWLAGSLLLAFMFLLFVVTNPDSDWNRRTDQRIPMALLALLVCVVAPPIPITIANYWMHNKKQMMAARQEAARLQSPAPEPIAKEVPPSPPPPLPARTCPKCSAPIASDAPQGMCPKCLMAGAFHSILDSNRTSAYKGSDIPPTPEEVQEFFPNLEILGLIGHGGMGAVYQARQPNLDRVVALKLIRPRDDNPMFAERFVREAKAMAKLHHPNIVNIHESGEAGGSLFLIMEFIDGVTLREAIRAKVIPTAEALKIVGQLCDALEYAHAQGVVHRDIKPENILLDRNGKVRVVDFGLAKLANDNGLSLTHTRQAMGTPHYMAPEQWEKPTEVDHRADIYALGVVIYELLTGELPLGRFDPPSVKSRLDARIDEIVLRLLAKEPDKRYQHASDVRTAFTNYGNYSPVPSERFYEYKSETTVLGWPLVHYVRGRDPCTGERPWATGVFAVGQKAIGVVAIGQIAVGVLAIGQIALGLLAIGQLALGPLFALGQFAISLVFAIGMFSLAFFSIGLMNVGYFAIGMTAWGYRVISSSHRDADFADRFLEDVLAWFN